MYKVYVLKSLSAAKSYTGITDNIERRIVEHNSGKHFYTKRYTPWRVLYTEELLDRVAARKREKYLKSASGRRFLEKIFMQKEE